MIAHSQPIALPNASNPNHPDISHNPINNASGSTSQLPLHATSSSNSTTGLSHITIARSNGSNSRNIGGSSVDYAMQDGSGGGSYTGSEGTFNPASFTRHFLGSPISWRAASWGMPSSMGNGGNRWNGHTASPSQALFSSIDLNDIRMGKTPSSASSDSIMNALNVFEHEGELCRNYTCCGMHLPDLHALLEHFEEVHIVVVDPTSAQPQAHIQIPFNPTAHDVDPQSQNTNSSQQNSTQNQQQQASQQASNFFHPRDLQNQPHPLQQQSSLSQYPTPFDTDDMELDLELDLGPPAPPTHPPPSNDNRTFSSTNNNSNQYGYSSSLQRSSPGNNSQPSPPDTPILNTPLSQYPSPHPFVSHNLPAHLQPQITNKNITGLGNSTSSQQHQFNSAAFSHLQSQPPSPYGYDSTAPSTAASTRQNSPTPASAGPSPEQNNQRPQLNVSVHGSDSSGGQGTPLLTPLSGLNINSGNNASGNGGLLGNLNIAHAHGLGMGMNLGAMAPGGRQANHFAAHPEDAFNAYARFAADYSAGMPGAQFNGAGRDAADVAASADAPAQGAGEGQEQDYTYSDGTGCVPPALLFASVGSTSSGGGEDGDGDSSAENGEEQEEGVEHEGGGKKTSKSTKRGSKDRSDREAGRADREASREEKSAARKEQRERERADRKAAAHKERRERKERERSERDEREAAAGNASGSTAGGGGITKAHSVPIGLHMGQMSQPPTNLVQQQRPTPSIITNTTNITGTHTPLNGPSTNPGVSAAAAAASLLMSKPFRCPKPNCNKSYKQANGLKYHMTHGSCNFAPPKDLEHVKDLLERKRREREVAAQAQMSAGGQMQGGMNPQLAPGVDPRQMHPGLQRSNSLGSAQGQLHVGQGQQGQHPLAQSTASSPTSPYGNGVQNGFANGSSQSNIGQHSQTAPPTPLSPTSILSLSYSDLALISEADLRDVEREAERRLRPFACGVGECTRRYKNMNGLRYHYQHSGDHGAVGLALLASGQHECLGAGKRTGTGSQHTNTSHGHHSGGQHHQTHGGHQVGGARTQNTLKSVLGTPSASRVHSRVGTPQPQAMGLGLSFLNSQPSPQIHQPQPQHQQSGLSLSLIQQAQAQGLGGSALSQALGNLNGGLKTTAITPTTAPPVQAQAFIVPSANSTANSRAQTPAHSRAGSGAAQPNNNQLSPQTGNTSPQQQQTAQQQTTTQHQQMAAAYQMHYAQQMQYQAQVQAHQQAQAQAAHAQANAQAQQQQQQQKAQEQVMELDMDMDMEMGSVKNTSSTMMGGAATLNAMNTSAVSGGSPTSGRPRSTQGSPSSHRSGLSALGLEFGNGSGTGAAFFNANGDFQSQAQQQNHGQQQQAGTNAYGGKQYGMSQQQGYDLELELDFGGNQTHDEVAAENANVYARQQAAAAAGLSGHDL